MIGQLARSKRSLTDSGQRTGAIFVVDGIRRYEVWLVGLNTTWRVLDEMANLKIIDIFVVISDNKTGIVSKEAGKVFPSYRSNQEQSGSIDHLEIYGVPLARRELLDVGHARSTDMDNIFTSILLRISGPTATCSTTFVVEALLDGWTGCSSLGFGVHLRPATGDSNYNVTFVLNDLGHAELLNFSWRMLVAPS